MKEDSDTFNFHIRFTFIGSFYWMVDALVSVPLILLTLHKT